MERQGLDPTSHESVGGHVQHQLLRYSAAGVFAGALSGTRNLQGNGNLGRDQALASRANTESVWKVPPQHTLLVCAPHLSSRL